MTDLLATGSNMDWPNAQAALKAGKRVRREVWVTWVSKQGGKLYFDLPHNWEGGRVYWPTDIDKAAEDWEEMA